MIMAIHPGMGDSGMSVFSASDERMRPGKRPRTMGSRVSRKRAPIPAMVIMACCGPMTLVSRKGSTGIIEMAKGMTNMLIQPRRVHFFVFLTFDQASAAWAIK